MTSLEDFYAAIDRAPDDFQLRLVFADWLDEFRPESGLGPGYRALGQLCHAPHVVVCSDGPRTGLPIYTWFDADNPVNAYSRTYPASCLPGPWFKLLSGGMEIYSNGWPVTYHRGRYAPRWYDWYDRRGAEDAAALSYALMEDRRKDTV